MTRRKKFYQKRKTERRCVNCGKQDERTLNGKTECAECTDKRSRYYAAQNEIQRKLHRISNTISNAQRYYRRQENHECVTCGMKMPENWYYVRCEACREHQKAYRKKKKTA